MELDRRQRHLQNLLSSRLRPEVAELVPVVHSWERVLSQIPGLSRRRPGAHCRVGNLQNGVLTVEVDHPAWMQLLQWHEGQIVQALGREFIDLDIRTVQWRLLPEGASLGPTVVMPDPVKPEMTPQEQEDLSRVLAELESLVRKNNGLDDSSG